MPRRKIIQKNFHLPIDFPVHSIMYTARAVLQPYFGVKAFLNPSPVKLNAETAQKSASPGNSVRCQ